MRAARQIVETITHYEDGTRAVTTVCTGRSVVEACVLYRALQEMRAELVVEDELGRIANGASE